MHLARRVFDISNLSRAWLTRGRMSADGAGADFRHRRLAGVISTLLVGLAAVNLAWLPFSTVSTKKDLWIGAAIAAIPLVVLWAALGAMRRQLGRTPFLHRDILKRISGSAQAFVATVILIMLFSVGLLLLSYLASATGRPPVDEYLAAGDAGLGFDWIAYVGWLNSHPWIASTISSAYSSLQPQLFLLPAVLILTARSDRLLEFAAHFGLAGCLTCAVMAALPATGAFDLYHLSPDLLSSFGPGASTRHLEQLHALRTLRPFLLEHPEGLVTFPSFHSALAVILVYSVRGIRYVAPPIYVLNALLILATPPQGSHYLVDVLAGFAVAAVSIRSVSWIACGRAIEHKSEGFARP